MPKFNVTAPDGTIYSVNAPDGATEDDAIAYIQREHGVDALYFPNLGSIPARRADGMAVSSLDPC